MHKLHELKEMLCEELEQYGDKEKLDVGSLDVVDKLAHAIKNIDKIIEVHEDGYSGDMYPYSREYRYDGRSYAGTGRRGGAKRDSMGRYSSSESNFAEDLRELVKDAPNDRMRQKLQNILSDM